ncbi:Uncharacterised protein [uncultured archaeon]|nr:Uncharacterised protein [uncultured archaeon]
MSTDKTNETTNDILREGKAMEIIHDFSFKLKELGDAFLLKKIKRLDFVTATDTLSKEVANKLNALYGHPPTAPDETVKLQVIVLNDNSKDAHVSISFEGKEIGEGYCKNVKAEDTGAGIPKGATTRRVINCTLEMPKDKFLRRLENNVELPPEA